MIGLFSKAQGKRRARPISTDLRAASKKLKCLNSDGLKSTTVGNTKKSGSLPCGVGYTSIYHPQTKSVNIKFGPVKHSSSGTTMGSVFARLGRAASYVQKGNVILPRGSRLFTHL